MPNAGLIWLVRSLNAIAIATGISLAAASVFYLTQLELALTFIGTFIFALLFLSVLASGGRALRRMISGVGGIGNVLTQGIVVLVLMAVFFFVGLVVFGAVDQFCRLADWPPWYCR